MIGRGINHIAVGMLLALVTAGLTAAYIRGKNVVQAKWDAERLLLENKALEQGITNAKVTVRRMENIAQSEAERAGKLRQLEITASKSRDELERLRDTIAAMSSSPSPGNTCTAETERANTASTLLATCSERYSELARKADGHAADAETLVNSWPK